MFEYKSPLHFARILLQGIVWLKTSVLHIFRRFDEYLLIDSLNFLVIQSRLGREYQFLLIFDSQLICGILRKIHCTVWFIAAKLLRMEYPCRLVLEEDGTEVDDNAFLCAMLSGTRFLLLKSDEHWRFRALFEYDSGTLPVNDCTYFVGRSCTVVLYLFDLKGAKKLSGNMAFCYVQVCCRTEFIGLRIHGCLWVATFCT